MSDKTKDKIYILIILVIIVGAIIPFAAQFILPFWFSNENVVGAEVWNQYVSIILGIVATITSIVSLILGFKSEQQSKETELRTRDMLLKIESKIELMSQKQDQLGSSLSKDYKNSESSYTNNMRGGITNPNDESIG